MKQVRLARLAHSFVREINLALVRGEIRDRRVRHGITVVDVIFSRDGRRAVVEISSFSDQSHVEDAVKGLNHAAGFVQRLIASRLRVPMIPKLRFEACQSIPQSFQMTNKISTLNS